MPKLIVVTRNGEESELEAEVGQSVMVALTHHGIDELQATCGGFCSCATCHVYIDPAYAARLPGMSEDESFLLDGSMHRQETSRLSCQLTITDDIAGLKLIIAPEG